MTTKPDYSPKAMAIGAVIDALQCEESDIIDIHLLILGRLQDHGYFVPPLKASEQAILDLHDDDDFTLVTDESAWAL